MGGKAESQRELRQKLRRLEKERDEARESADLLQAVLDSTYDAIVIHSPDGQILDVNQAFQRLHGISREEARRLTIADLSAQSMPMETAAKIWARVAGGEDHHFEWKGKRYQDGTEFDAEIFLRRVRRENQNVILAHVRDVTRYKQAAAEIRDSQQRLRQAFDLLEGITEGTEDLIAAQDTGYRYILFNRAYRQEFKRIFGADLQVGSSMVEALAHLPRDQKRVIKRLWGRALKGEAFIATEELGFPGPGRQVYEMRYSPLRDAAGTLVGAAHIVRNVTANVQAVRKLRRREEQFRAFFENAAVGAVQMDLHGRFLRVNDCFCKIVGYAPEDLRGRSVLEITHPEDLQRTRESLRDLRSDEISIYRHEKRYLRKDGNEVWVDVSNGLAHDAEGTPLHIVSVVQDMSGRKRMELDLLASKKEAEEANLAKSQFLANMSHELRTPMTVILGALEFLRASRPTPEQDQFLTMADSSAHHLLGIIDDLLDISRIEAQQLSIEEQPFELRHCVRQAVEMFAPTAREKGIRLHWTIAPRLPELVRGDPGRIGQVLINLVGNAVKFTRSGEVAVNVTEGNNELVFSIRDSGIGIAEDKRDRIFKPFSQVDSSLTRPYGGTGLGLAISRELVEMMGGVIGVKSELGKGSTFTFTVPLRLEELPAAPEPPKAEAKNVQPLKVLLAEDDPSVRELVKMILQRRGLPVTVAENGREAVANWQAGEVDLILMDLQMPEMNGLEAAMRIRELENGTARKTCIFALTAHVRPEDRQKCLDAGMDGFLAKPIQMDELNHLIETCPCGRGANRPGQ